MHMPVDFSDTQPVDFSGRTFDTPKKENHDVIFTEGGGFRRHVFKTFWFLVVFKKFWQKTFG